MKLDNLSTIEQMGAFLEGSQAVAFAVATNKDERYLFVERLLTALRTQGLGVAIRVL